MGGGEGAAPPPPPPKSYKLGPPCQHEPTILTKCNPRKLMKFLKSGLNLVFIISLPWTFNVFANLGPSGLVVALL